MENIVLFFWKSTLFILGHEVLLSSNYTPHTHKHYPLMECHKLKFNIHWKVANHLIKLPKKKKRGRKCFLNLLNLRLVDKGVRSSNDVDFLHAPGSHWDLSISHLLHNWNYPRWGLQVRTLLAIIKHPPHLMCLSFFSQYDNDSTIIHDWA